MFMSLKSFISANMHYSNQEIKEASQVLSFQLIANSFAEVTIIEIQPILVILPSKYHILVHGLNSFSFDKWKSDVLALKI